MSNPTYTKTVSEPIITRINYRRQNGFEGFADVSSVDESVTATQFQSVRFTDESGVDQIVDIATSRLEVRRRAAAIANGAWAANRLSRDLGVPSGSAATRTETIYTAKTSTAGLLLTSEISRTRMSLLELAGGLPVPSYSDYEPRLILFESARRDTVYTTQFGFDGPTTYEITSTWLALGLTQEGQQLFAEQVRQQRKEVDFDSGEGGDFIKVTIESMTELIYQGDEIRSFSGIMLAPIKARDQELSRSTITQNDSGNRTDRFRTQTIFNGRSRTYIMPYAPDGFFIWEEP